MSDPTHDERSRNFYGHGQENLRMRDEAARRGVPADQLGPWSLDARNSSREAYMNDPAPRPNSLNESADLDAMARAQGFPSYEAMIAWQRNRNNIQSGSRGAPPARDVNSVREQQKLQQPRETTGIGFIDRIINAMRGD